MKVPDIYPTNYPASAERNSKAQQELVEKMSSTDIEDYKISIPYQDTLDTSMIIIGVNTETLEMDIFGYHYRKEILEYVLDNLRNKFSNYKFVIKQFDSVL